jgi:F-type H+-transporting ATPase subunit epsilon
MAAAMKFELVSPERLLVSAEVEQVVIPGSEGDMTVLVNHAPVLTSVRPGLVKVRKAGGAEEGYVVFGGFADITAQGCTLLAESAVRTADIDRAELEKRLADAREDVADARDAAAKAKAQTHLDHLTTLAAAISR